MFSLGVPFCGWLKYGTHGRFPRPIRPYSPCLRHSTSALRYNCHLCSGTPCPNICACLLWREKQKTNSQVIYKRQCQRTCAIVNASVCRCVCVPTTLFIAVVPTVVVSVAVPEAANTVAVLAVKLVLLALSGSCREKRFHVMRIQQKQRAGTV